MPTPSLSLRQIHTFSLPDYSLRTLCHYPIRTILPIMLDTLEMTSFSLQLQFEILCCRVLELESEADARRPLPPSYPPPVIPPPPSSPPPVTPSFIHVPIEGYDA
ncbi:hypothetical protein Hanom_Chr05g00408121 [Helianthus anomalus]